MLFCDFVHNPTTKGEYGGKVEKGPQKGTKSNFIYGLLVQYWSLFNVALLPTNLSCSSVLGSFRNFCLM